MTYIGGTLYAPVGFDHEAFKKIFDQLAQASLEVNEPSAIGKGSVPADESVRLLIKTGWIEESPLMMLENSLQFLCSFRPVVIEAVGDQQIHAKDDYGILIAEVVATRHKQQETAQQWQAERIKRDARDRRLANMTTDELRNAGYYDEARIREDQEADYSEDPYYG